MDEEWYKTRAYSSHCISCGAFGLCVADCSLGPWNFDKPRTSFFGYLLRKRRWAQHPVKYVDEVDTMRLYSSLPYELREALWPSKEI